MENRSLKRIRDIVKRYGLAEYASSHARYFGYDENDVFRYAPCVCAGAYDKFRHNPETAEAVCDEVWSDSWLFSEHGFRMTRERSLERLEEQMFAPHRLVRFENIFARDLRDVIILLKCAGCGKKFRINYHTATVSFRTTCPHCRRN